MNKALLILTLACGPVFAQLNVPLTIQEALYPGDSTGHTTVSGSGGIARTNEPFCMGVPVADSAAIAPGNLSSLGLIGATAGQFRILGTWPDGNAMWIKACGEISNLAAGASTTVTLTSSGGGNFGGSNLAVDSNPGNANSGSITVATGAATFTINKPNFNGLDIVSVGATGVVAKGTSDGFVIRGPASPNTTCGVATPCTTEYRSKNDSTSTCSVDENGPVVAVVKCNWNYNDASGNTYMRGSARLYFYAQKTYARIVPVLHNADYGPVTGSASTAFKALQSYELRTAVNVGGSANFTMANHTATPTTGTLSGSDNAYIYQGQSLLMGDSGWSGCNSPCTNFTLDSGYRIAKNGASLISGSASQYPQGWADVSSTSGAGVEIGAYQFASNGPKSLEFNSGGTVATIGLFANENTFPVYQAWPQWKTDEIYLNFHSASPALSNEFLKLQHPLVGRASRQQYNSSGVFLYTLEDPAEEDTYYTSVVNAANPVVSQSRGCCIQDVGTVDYNWPLFNYPGGYVWNQGGGRNQLEWRYSYLMNFITRGHTGRYLGAKQFFMSQVDMSGPHSDGFNWRDKPHTNAGSPEVDGYGMPIGVSPAPKGTVNIASDGVTVTLVSGAYFVPWQAGLVFTINGANYSISTIVDPSHLILSTSTGGPLSGATYVMQTPLGSTNLRSWSDGNGPDQEHRHWWGILDYYFMTGDETVHEAVNNSMLDFFLNPDTYQNGEIGGSLNGKVTTNGAAVTLSSGSSFQPFMVGGPIMINGIVYIVSTVNSGTSLTLTASAGAQSNALYYALGGVWNARSIGVELSGSSRYSRFLQATGDPTDAAAVLQQGVNDYLMQVKPPLCVSGTCSYGPTNGGPWTSQGISPSRGVHNTRFDAGINPCNVGDYRAEGIFQASILMQGLWELRTVEGPAWPEYMTALDLAYAQSLWVRTEGANSDGTSSWTTNGLRYYVTLDIPNAACDTVFYPVRSNQTVWFPFFVAHQVEGSMASWQPLFNQVMQRTMSSNGIGTGTSSSAVDFGGYQLGALIDIVERPGTTTLNSLPITGFTSNGGGSYTISWTVPAGAQSYRIKWGALPIVDWIGFNPVTNSFTGDPVHTMNWFAATNVASIPAPAAAGSTQSLTINTGTAALTAGNFSVKAYTPATTAPVLPASRLQLVSGNGQTGATGKPLTSPLTVMVADANGNPIAGTSVTFAVSVGGGSLTNLQTTTNGQGQASATLVLGPNAGANTVIVSSGSLAGSPVTFNETAQTSNAANLVAVSGNGQIGTVGQQLSTPITVEVTDSNGNPVSGIAISFTVAGGGTISAAQVQTNSAGTASTILTLGQVAGTNTVVATSASLAGSPISFTATAAVAGPTSTTLTWNKAPSTSAGWPTSNGYMQMNWDPVSRKTIIYGHRGFSGSVKVTNGSNVVSWVSGDKFADFWQATDRISIGGNNYAISASPTNPVSPPLTNNKTQLTLATNYSGSTAVTSYTAAESPIYSNDVIFYDAGSNTWTWGPGTGAQQDLCIVDTPSMPGQRHPIGQMAIDTQRGLLWLTGGVNQSCTIQPVTTNGSTTVVGSPATQFVMGANWNGVTACIGTGAASCTNYTVDHVIDQQTVVMTANVPAGQTFFRVLAPENKNPQAPNAKYDTYYLKLNSDPTADAWTQVTTASHVPDAIVLSAMRYDPDDDVIVLFGNDGGSDVHDTFAYCSSIGNPGGTLTAKQTAAGCAKADDWTEVTTSCVGSLCTRNHPPGSTFPAMVWDTATHKLLQYGGTQGYLGTPQNVIFAYDIPTHSWTQKTAVNVPPPILWTGSCCLQSAATIAYDSQTQKLFYHYLNNNTSADYLYDPVADTWSLIGSPSAGTGATATNGASGQMATYDAANNMIIGWNEGGAADIWRGSISGALTVTPAGACDLNGDGVVNALDVQIAINQALGIAPCGNADLIGNGVCSIVDVQRIVNASTGGTCKTGT